MDVIHQTFFDLGRIEKIVCCTFPKQPPLEANLASLLRLRGYENLPGGLSTPQTHPIKPLRGYGYGLGRTVTGWAVQSRAGPYGHGPGPTVTAWAVHCTVTAWAARSRLGFANFDFFGKLRTAVYPSNMAPIGLKLGQNAFQTIPDISFFDAPKVENLRKF